MFELSISNSSMAGLKRVLSGIDSRLTKQLDNALMRSVRLIKKNIAEEAPEGSGRLKNKIMRLPINGEKSVISVLARNSRKIVVEIDLSRKTDSLIRWVNYGTGLFGPYGQMIRPTRSKFMRFEINGDVIFARETKGQRPQHFIENGVNRSRLAVISIIKSALK